MPPVVALDFYEPDGSTLIGTLDDSQLVASEARPALYELGALRFVVSRHLAEASSALLAKGNYVKYRVPSVSEDPIALFVLKDDLSVLIDKAEKGAEYLEVRGPGGLWILQFARLREEVYAPAQPTRGDWDDDVSWNWRNRNYGAIFVRAIEEGQNQPGTPLGAISIDFDRDVDSDGVPWAVIAADFSVPIGTDVLALADRLAAAGDFYPVLTPDMVLHAYQTYGRNLTGAFASDNVRFQKGVNIQTELKRSRTLDRVTHLITRDLDAVYRTYVTPDAFDQAVYAFLDISWTNDADQVEKTALNLLAASNDAAQLYVFETSPGFAPVTGEYMPGPVGTDGHFWPGDEATIHTGTGEHDLNAAAARVTAVSLVLDTAADGSSDTTAARSLHIVPELVIGIPRPQFSGVGDSPGAQGIACLCLRLCDPTIIGDPDDELYNVTFLNGVAESVAAYPSGVADWPITAARLKNAPGSDGMGYVESTIAGTGGGSPKLPATAGETYRFEFDTRYGYSVRLRFFNSSNVQLQETQVNHTEGNVWIPRSNEVVAPATTAYMQFTPVGRIDVDHIRITHVGSGIDTQNPYAGIERRAARCDHTHPAADHDHDTEYTPIGHGHLFDDLADVDMSTVAPEDGDEALYDALTETWIPGRWEPVTNGDVTTPEIVFEAGDVVMERVS